MKIVVSIKEFASEARIVIDNMRHSNAPVMIGDDVAHPQAVLLSVEEYERLQRLAKAATAPQSEAAANSNSNNSNTHKSSVTANVVPATQQSNVAKRTAATVQADRAAAMPTIVSQRSGTLQPDPTLVTNKTNKKEKTPLQGARLTRPLPKPPFPIEDPNSGFNMPSLASVPGGWQTIALVAGVLLLGIVGLVLIVNAFG